MKLDRYLRTAFPSQRDAARAFGVSQGTISNWIRGVKLPRPTKATQIVRRSRGKVSLDAIYGASR